MVRGRPDPSAAGPRPPSLWLLSGIWLALPIVLMGTVAACGGSECVFLGERIKEGGDVALDINHKGQIVAELLLVL